MQEIINQVLDQLRGLWRFRWPAMIAAWIVCVAGWLGVMAMPDMYEATARVFVDTRTALSPVIKDIAISQDVDAQLNYVQQSLLGGPSLEGVARKANFGIDTATPERRAQILSSLRTRVELGASAVGGSNGGANRDGGAVYTLKYQDSQRARSLEVVQTLLTTFIEDTLGGKRNSANKAQKFLEDQIQDYERQLRAAEQSLADFERRNVGLMPGTEGDRLKRLEVELDAERKAQSDLAVATTRRTEIERQLRGEAPYTQASTPTMPGVPANDTASRIKEAQARLDDLLLRFTDKHPDVVALRGTLVELQQRRANELAALKRGDPNALADARGSSNPVYQNIQLALNQVDVEIAALRQQLSDHQANIVALRRMTDTAPQVKAEYLRLTRDNEVIRGQYVALKDRLEKARLGDEAAATGSVRFEVIDPPNAKFEPVAPQRTSLVLVVLLAGIAAGGGLAFVLNQWKPVFSNGRSLSEVTGLPLLGVVSFTWLNRRKNELRRSYAMYAMAFGALLLMFIVAALFNDSGAHLMRQVFGSVA
jgi:polysaccharide chain length determinant protein (PEP-CTERM system associated)